MGSLIEGLGLWATLGVFAAAAAVILIAGTKLEAAADELGKATKLGQMFAGMILLAIATSLPELATTVTATLRGNVEMAVNNLLGGVVVQTMVLAAADAVGARAALTRNVPSFALLIQGVGLIVILTIVAISATLEVQFRDALPIGVGPAVVATVYALMQYVTIRSRNDPRWAPTSSREKEDAPREEHEKGDAEDGNGSEPGTDGGTGGKSLLGLGLRYLVLSVFVCAGGFAVVLATERLSSITGAGQGFLGFTLVAFATSLPEVSTTFSAARRGHPVAAVSNIFGSNSFDVALLAIVAVLSDKGIFRSIALQSVFAATLGALMTGIYLVGILERRNRSFLRMGWDSIVILVLGGAGMWLLHAFTSSS